MPSEGLLGLAEGYLRTAQAAASNADWPQAYENARTAAELAAKHLLARNGIVAVAKEHDVAPLLVQANLWPGGAQGRRLSLFLGDYTRGIYDVHESVSRGDAERGIRMAQTVMEKGRA
ncbi:MAG TPA: HEPN domain-containing protein [Candidatus Thermoplasmatota archaeon]|nr:HEPN domain-containing protein [Candidatus Thermoplasmatota archaeon]